MNVPADEQRLATALDRFASQVTTPHDGRARVAQRLAVRRRRRRTTVVAGVALLAAGLGVGLTHLPDTDRSGVSTAGLADHSGGDSRSPSDGSGVEAASIPDLTVDLPGMTLVGADISAPTATDQRAGDPGGFYYFQSFRRASDDWRLPGVFVFTTTPESRFEIGERSPADQVTTVDINGHTGYLHLPEVGLTALGWRLDDGTTAFVVAPGMAPDDLVALGRRMQPRTDRQGWAVPGLPDGLVPVIDAANTPRPFTGNHSLRFEGDASGIELNSSQSTPSRIRRTSRRLPERRRVRREHHGTRPTRSRDPLRLRHPRPVVRAQRRRRELPHHRRNRTRPRRRRHRRPDRTHPGRLGPAPRIDRNHVLGR